MSLAISDSVKVFLRVRSDDNVDSIVDDEISTEKMIVVDKNAYTFDHCFYSSSSQTDLFQIMIEPQVDKLFEGYNSSVLAYGQSGAGKTSTLGFDDYDNGKNGLVEMAIAKIFQKLEGQEDFEVSASFIEIYNEKVFDLLSDKCQESIYSKGSKFQGSTKVPITNSSEAHLVLQRGSKNRHVRATNLNTNSSRSHAMISIFVTTSGITSVMHICDLAGSEGIRNTHHTGAAQKESVNINQGLLAVSKVVQALNTGSSSIPYRDSVLTIVLQDSLNAKSFITILGCISSARKDKTDTISTIRFAHSVKTLDNKNIPEFNAYQSQKQNVPRPYMLPVPNKETTKTPAKRFQTPNTSIYPSTVKKRPLAQSTLCKSFNTSAKASDKIKIRKTTISRKIENSFLPQMRESSIDNNTFNVLNFSTSTEVDAVPSRTTRDQSNINTTSLSPFMREMRNMVDEKLSMFLKTQEKPQEPEKIICTTEVATNFDMTEFNDTLASDTFNMPPPQTTSTVLRKPLQPRQDLTNVDFKKLSTLRLVKSKLETTSIPGFNDQTFTNNLTRTFNQENHETVVYNDETVKPLRRSSRISMIEEKRNATLLTTLTTTMKTSSKSKNKKPSIFDLSPNSKPISKTAHKNKVLVLLNTGKFKEITKLPVIGAKTAIQILTHLQVNGKFKSIDDLKGIEALKGKKWQKFLQANLLI